ncbi:MAG: protein BatD [bacterium]|nr:protein BatD [Candidatus Colousia faecequi]
MTFILVWLCVMPTWADGVTLRASAPTTVAEGQPFQLVYVVNEQGKDFRLPSLNGFEILAGPYVSTSQSTSIYNGKVTSTKEIRYTYTLQATKEGTFSIASASIVVNGQKYNSNAVTIKVLPEDKSAQAQQSQRGGGGQSASASNAGSPDRLFVKANFSRTKVMEQEAILVSYKLYAKDDVIGLENVKMPDFNGFLVQEIELPQNRGMRTENYNGQNYATYEIYKAILFPQHAGTITVDRFSCSVGIRVRVQRQSRGFFDGFFDSFQDVEKTITSGKANIEVTSLPQPKPVGFSGVVGSLNIDTKVSATELESNKPATVTVTITGSGNMKMLKTPELQFPKDFEAYEPKVTNNFTTTTSGQQGTKTIEYLVIPRHKGEFSVPAVTISYFDVNSRSYKTLSTREINFSVTKGTDAPEGSADVQNVQDQERVEMLAKDIRYLDRGALSISQSEDYLITSLLYWLCYVVMLLLTVALLFFFRKKIKDNANIALRKNRGANKVARRRLKVADREWRAGHKEIFYDEILKALWGYTSDKLSIPLADLNKDTMCECLTSKGVDPQTIDQFTALLNECEFQRYAPSGDANSAMEHTYKEAVNLISKFEDTVRR